MLVVEIAGGEVVDATILEFCQGTFVVFFLGVALQSVVHLLDLLGGDGEEGLGVAIASRIRLVLIEDGEVAIGEAYHGGVGAATRLDVHHVRPVLSLVDAHGQCEVLARARVLQIRVEHDVAFVVDGAAVVEDVGIAGVGRDLAVAPLRAPLGAVGITRVEAAGAALAHRDEQRAVVHLLELRLVAAGIGRCRSERPVFTLVGRRDDDAVGCRRAGRRQRVGGEHHRSVALEQSLARSSKNAPEAQLVGQVVGGIGEVARGELAHRCPGDAVVVAGADADVAHAGEVAVLAGSHQADDASVGCAHEGGVAIAIGGAVASVAHGDEVLSAPCASAIDTTANRHVDLMIAQVGIAAVAAVAGHDDVALLVEHHGRDAVVAAVVGGGHIGKALRGEDLRLALRVAE